MWAQICNMLEQSSTLFTIDTAINGPLIHSPDPNLSSQLAYRDGASNAVYVDLNAHPLENTSVGFQPASTEDLLGHELGHLATGTEDAGPGRIDNVNQNENRIRKDLKEPARVTYDLVL